MGPHVSSRDKSSGSPMPTPRVEEKQTTLAQAQQKLGRSTDQNLKISRDLHEKQMGNADPHAPLDALVGNTPSQQNVSQQAQVSWNQVSGNYSPLPINGQQIIQPWVSNGFSFGQVDGMMACNPSKLQQHFNQMPFLRSRPGEAFVPVHMLQAETIPHSQRPGPIGRHDGMKAHNSPYQNQHFNQLPFGGGYLDEAFAPFPSPGVNSISQAPRQGYQPESIMGPARSYIPREYSNQMVIPGNHTYGAPAQSFRQQVTPVPMDPSLQMHMSNIQYEYMMALNGLYSHQNLNQMPIAGVQPPRPFAPPPGHPTQRPQPCHAYDGALLPDGGSVGQHIGM